jgi:hypothetical protein
VIGTGVQVRRVLIHDDGHRTTKRQVDRVERGEISQNLNLNLARQMQVRRDALAALSEAAPNSQDLVPWAVTDNGEVCYWRTPCAAVSDE